jgi:hypothetical protein
MFGGDGYNKKNSLRALKQQEEQIMGMDTTRGVD